MSVYLRKMRGKRDPLCEWVVIAYRCDADALSESFTSKTKAVSRAEHLLSTGDDDVEVLRRLFVTETKRHHAHYTKARP